MSQLQTPTEKFVETVLRNTGLLQLIPAIISDIEEEIAGSYSAIDEGEDIASVPSYGGVIYDTHYLIDEGNWNYQLEKRTSDSQKRLLLKLVEDNNLSLSVERTNLRQKWNFILSPEIAPNTNERIEIDVEINISLFTPTSFSITATSDGEDVNFDEILFLLALSN